MLQPKPQSAFVVRNQLAAESRFSNLNEFRTRLLPKKQPCWQNLPKLFSPLAVPISIRHKSFADEFFGSTPFCFSQQFSTQDC
jgi:hypothetical protein